MVAVEVDAARRKTGATMTKARGREAEAIELRRTGRGIILRFCIWLSECKVDLSCQMGQTHLDYSPVFRTFRATIAVRIDSAPGFRWLWAFGSDIGSEICAAVVPMQCASRFSLSVMHAVRRTSEAHMCRNIGIGDICIVPLSTRINGGTPHHGTDRVVLPASHGSLVPGRPAQPCYSNPLHFASSNPLHLASSRFASLRSASHRSQLLNHNGRGRTSAIADRRDALLALLERVHEGDDDPASGGPDGL